MSRYFHLIYKNHSYGRFVGKNPKQAANKAFTSLFKKQQKIDKDINLNKEIPFSIIECTRRTKHKSYHYVGIRNKLNLEKRIIIRSGTNQKIITYRYRNNVKKDKKQYIVAKIDDHLKIFNDMYGSSLLIVDQIN